MPNHLGLIVGNGKLPILAIEDAIKNNNKFTVIGFNDVNYDQLLNIHKDIMINTFDILKPVEMLNFLKKNNINTVCICGGVKPPKIKPIDLFGVAINNLSLISYAAKILISKNHGDDFLLSIAESVVKAYGCKIIGIHELIPDLLSRNIDNINIKLTDKYKKDIENGIYILKTISDLDIGQSIVVVNNRVLGIEAAEGTDELILRCGRYAEQYKDARPVLIKIPKENQTRKIDLPTIGENTLKNLISANFAGIVVENGGNIIIDRHAVHEYLKKSNLFMKVI